MFNKGLMELRSYIRAIQLESQLSSLELNELAPMGNECLLLELKEQLLDNNTNNKRFEYNTLIVSLYGFFEQYIESVIRLYLGQLNKIIPKYNNMPESILKNQIDLSIKLIAPSEQARYRGTITTHRLISNLHSCLNNNSDYCVNVEAFSHHNANFRANNIQEIFARIGIGNITDRALKCPSYLRYLSITYPEDRIYLENPQIKKRALSFMDELADRRNEVAHGVPTDDILSNELILERINFFDAYCRAIFDIVNSELLAHKLKLFGKKLGKPIKIINKNIICILVNNQHLSLGDEIIAEPSNKNFPLQTSEIEEMQFNGKSLDEVPADCNKEIAIRVSFIAKKNHTLYLMPKSPTSFLG